MTSSSRPSKSLMRMVAAQLIPQKSIRFLKNWESTEEAPTFWGSSTALKRRANPSILMSSLTLLPVKLVNARPRTESREFSDYSTKTITEWSTSKSSKASLNILRTESTTTKSSRWCTAPTSTKRPQPTRASPSKSSTTSSPSSTTNEALLDHHYS